MNKVLLLLVSILLFGCCKDEKEFSFSVVGDMPYGQDDEQKLIDIVQHQNSVSDVDFMVHVGDIKEGDAPCDFYYYDRFNEIIKQSNIPVYALPGDNEWIDCEDQGASYKTWKELFTHNLDGHFGVKPNRSRHYSSTFSFIKNNVLFIGLTLPDADEEDYADLDNLIYQNTLWLDRNIGDYGSMVDMIVIFAHCKPDNDFYFRDDLFTIVQSVDKKVLWIQGDDHELEIKENWKGTNIDKITVSQEDRLVISVNGGKYEIVNN